MEQRGLAKDLAKRTAHYGAASDSLATASQTGTARFPREAEWFRHQERKTVLRRRHAYYHLEVETCWLSTHARTHRWEPDSELQERKYAGYRRARRTAGASGQEPLPWGIIRFFAPPSTNAGSLLCVLRGYSFRRGSASHGPNPLPPGTSGGDLAARRHPV